MTTGCRGGKGETLIFTCAGAAYSGQVANRAGVQLMEQGAGSLFCIAAVAADVPAKMDRARPAGQRIAIDGCEDHCVRKVLEKAGLTADLHVVLTDMGIEKKPAQPNMISDAKKVVESVKLKLDAGAAPQRGCCG
ncbi:MAG: putative zinc-binding protein [Planctomycetota bacterium]